MHINWLEDSLSTEADIDSKKLEEMKKFGFTRTFIKSILPEKYQKYSDLDKILDVQIHPIDQYQIKKFKQLAAEIEQDMNQHSDDMIRIRKELSLYVFSKILSILKKKIMVSIIVLIKLKMLYRNSISPLSISLPELLVSLTLHRR